VNQGENRSNGSHGFTNCGDSRADGSLQRGLLQHDPTTLPGLIAENCVIEKISPAPNGDRCIGREACIALWTEIATAPGSHFDLEETFVMGDRAIIRWRFWSSDTTSIRGAI